MRILAWVLAILGGLCAVMGIIVIVDVVPLFAELEWMEWMFWMLLAGVLLLGSIATSLGRGGGGYE